MSCFPESLYSVYVDGELPAAEVHAVESHLVQCQRCRGLIVALEEEGTLLRDVLQERRTEAAVPSPRRGRARGLSIGLVPAIGVAALVATVGGWLLDQRLPAGMAWVNPVSVIGVYEMIFDVIFMLRDEAPVLFDLAIAVGATAGGAAILTYLVSSLFRKLLAPATTSVLLLGLLLASAQPSGAVDVRIDQDRVEIASSERINTTLIVSANSIDIDGVVDGNVILLGERVSIRGEILGQLIVGARELLIIGKIDGNVLMGCELCSIEGEINGTVLGGGEKIHVLDSARITRDVALYGEAVRVEGRVDRDVFAGGRWVELAGQIGRNVHSRSEHFSLLEVAAVGHDLDVQAADLDNISIAAGTKIGGEIVQGVLEHPMPQPKSRWMRGGFYMRSMAFLASAFLVGMALHMVFPGLFYARVETSGDFIRCLGFGFMALVATPVLLLICFITVIGIPIGIIGSFVYLTTLFVSVIVISALIGMHLTKVEPYSPQGFGMALILGLVIVVVGMNLPFIGGLLRLLIGLTGMGLLIVSAMESWQNSRTDYAA